MLDIVGKKNFYFLFSAVIIIPGLIALILWGLRLGIDFTGGTLLEVKIENQVSKEDIKKTLEEKVLENVLVSATENSFLIRTKPLDDKESNEVLKNLEEKFGKIEKLRLETVGPTIGSELLRKALISLVLASLAIIAYVTFAFREIPAPASSLRFGICAIIALLHDVFVVIGSFSLLGKFIGVEVDSLFVTALLTIIGFSVHDTIVVFDRIRENLKKRISTSFAETVNHSIMQTLARSLNTSLTVILVLLALTLFGGTNIRWFVIALLIGVISGTYSSIFNAAPLLVLWQEWSEKRKGPTKS